jgi:tetratricopeptide (TPR) repeat protein
MLDEIRGALRAGNADAALAPALRWTEAEPANAEAWLWLAHARAAGRDSDAAGAALERALALAPDRADLLAARAYLDLQSRDLGRAEAGLKDALAQDPNQLGAYVALAHLALSRGDMAEADQHVAYARRLDAEHPRVLVLEAQLLGRRGDADRGLALLQKSVELAPDDPLCFAALGLALFERRHFAFAAATLRRAVALSGAAPALRSVLVSALEAQDLIQDALAETEAWVSVEPASPSARWHRARLRARSGQVADALADVEAVQRAVPRHANAFQLGIQLAGELGGADAVVRAVDARIAADPDWALPWRTLLNLVRPDQVSSAIRAWREAAPNNGEALEAAALLAEREGQEGEALALAAEAIEREPRLLEARLLQARAAAFLEPEAAVARVDALIQAAVEPAQVRALAGWRGAALHRAGRAAEALAAWRHMWTSGPAHGLPLPNPQPASAARPDADGGEGRLLWGLPASRIERVHAALLPVAPERVLIDRWQRPMRDDGFNLLRVAPTDPLAGTAARWRAPLDAAGVPPAVVIDCLPCWDGWTQATLHGTTLVAVLRDPRDLLINWMAWGSAAGFAFPGPDVASAWLCRVLDQLIEAGQRHPGRVLRIDADRLDSDPTGFAAELTAALGLETAPDLAAAQALGRHPNGEPADFAAGAWRLYAEPLQAAFAPLAERAVALGYSAD